MSDDYNSDQQTASQRTPPHSVEAEQSVLGSLMLDERAPGKRWPKPCRTMIFYRHDHRLIFRAIQHLVAQEQPIDVVTSFRKSWKNVRSWKKPAGPGIFKPAGGYDSVH